MRAEEEKRMAERKKQEEERRQREVEEKKQKDIEEKRKRLEEAEKKRQAMMAALKEQTNKSKGPNFTISKKEGVSVQPYRRLSIYYSYIIVYINIFCNIIIGAARIFLRVCMVYAKLFKLNT